MERFKTNRGVAEAGGEAEEGVFTLSGVVVAIASVGWRDNSSRTWRKRKAAKHEQNCSECDV